MTDITRQLTSVVGDRLKEHEPLAKHTNFRIGGPARWWAEVKTEDELKRVLEIAQNEGVRFHIQGGGSNTLYADTGFDGMIIVPALREIAMSGTTVTAGAGVLSVMLARKTAQEGLKGLEWMISLPGTVGGAVRGNAGCFGGETVDHLASVRVLRPIGVTRLRSLRSRLAGPPALQSCAAGTPLGYRSGTDPPLNVNRLLNVGDLPKDFKEIEKCLVEIF